MNKKFIALAVAALASTSVSAAEIFNDGTSSLALGGRAEARASIMDRDATNEGTVNDASRVRLNIRGTTEIAEGVYGFGFFEREFKEGESSDTNRYVNAGISTQYGAVAYGLTDGSLGMVTDFTDIMAYHSAQASTKLTVADRTGNNLLYVGEFGGLTVKANYVFEHEETISDVKVQDFGGYSAAATYAMENGLAFGLGYASQDEGKHIDTDQIEAAVSYAFGDFYVAALYNKADTEVLSAKGDLTGYELAASYTMGNTVFATAYMQQEVEANSKSTDTVDALAIDATHYFNDNFRAYASYNFNMIKNAENELALGLRYDF